MPEDYASIRELLLRMEAESGRRFASLETRLDSLAAASIPPAAYEERSRTIHRDIAALQTLVADEVATRKAAIREIEGKMTAEAAARTMTVRWLLSGIVVAVGTSVVDLLSIGGA